MNIENYNLVYIGYGDCMKSIEDKTVENVSIYSHNEMLGIEEFHQLKVLEFGKYVEKKSSFPKVEVLSLLYFKDSIEIFISLLKQQPNLKKLYISASTIDRYHDDYVEPVKIFDKIEEFAMFFDKFENLEKIILERNEDSFSEAIELTPSDTSKPYIQGYRNNGFYAKVKEHEFLKGLTTLKKLELPKSKDRSFLNKLLESNPNIEELSASWQQLDTKWLLKEYKHFEIDDKHQKNYNKLLEELKSIDDDEKEELMRLFLVETKPPFKPKIKTLLAFLNCSVTLVRKEALKCFNKHYSQKIEGLSGLNIWLSGTLQTYKNTQAKEMLAEKEAKLSTKETDKTDLLVVGLKPKIDNLPIDIPIISAIKFEEMLSQSEERVLVTSDNEMIFEKLKKLLESNDESNVEVACTLMEEGGIPTDLRSYVLALFTISHKKKRTRLKKIIERHAGTLGEKFLAIMGRKSSIDSKMLKQFEALEGFDMEILMYVRNEEHYFTSKNTPLAKEMILKHFNEEQVWLYSEPSEHFLEARKIKELLLSGTNHILWKMTHLERIFLAKWNDNGLSKLNEVLISKEAENLKNLQRLTIHSQDISVDASLPITHLEIGSCKKLKMGNKTLFNTLEIVGFDSCSLALIKSVDTFLTKRKMPKLKKIIFDNGYGADRKFPSKILSFLKEEFQGIDIDLRRFGE